MELLFEIFGEEIPARMQLDAANKLAEEFKIKFKEISGHDIEVSNWVTPRRISFCARNMPTKIAARSEDIRGPKISAPEQALAGFLGKYNISKDILHIKDGYYYFTLTIDACYTSTVIKGLIEEILKSFVWPKSMRAGRSSTRWVRPFHSMLCILDGKVIPVEFGNIVASDKSFGHRFMAPEEFEINNFEDYKTKLATRKVIISHEERQTIIRKQANKIAKGKGLRVVEDKALVEEIAGLVEFPVVLLGEIDAEFMQLPREVLVITLRHHQRYIMLEEEDGSLASYYFIVANIEATDNGQEIIKGNGKVLRARLSDARFFYEQDCKTSLNSRIEELKKLIFHKDIGTVFDKMLSTKAMAIKITDQVGFVRKKAEQAVELAKTDLVTNMVKEFPELQGIMGYYYAKNDKLSDELAIAIRDQYKPQGPYDRVPENTLGAIVAISEKLDTLSQMFTVGIKPTGSKDPYALRRAAIGILRIIDEHKLPLNLQDLDLHEDVLKFIEDRKHNI